MLLDPCGTGYGAGTLARAPAGMLARVPPKRLALIVRASTTEVVKQTAVRIPINAKGAFAITRMGFSFLTAPHISCANANLQ